MDAISVIERALLTSLGLVFLISVLPKLRAPAQFGSAVVAYRVLPPEVARPFAYIVIVVELGLAISFAIEVGLDLSLPVAALLLSAFLIAVALNLRRGHDVPCACFGDPSERISGHSIARLLILLPVVVMLLVSEVIASGSSLLGGSGILTRATEQGLDLVLASLAGVGLFLVGMWLLEMPRLLASNSGRSAQS